MEFPLSIWSISVILITTSALFDVVKCEEFNGHEVETVGITYGIIPGLNEVKELFNEAQREKREVPLEQELPRFQTTNLNCKNSVERLTTAFRQKALNVPKPVGIYFGQFDIY